MIHKAIMQVFRDVGEAIVDLVVDVISLILSPFIPDVTMPDMGEEADKGLSTPISNTAPINVIYGSRKTGGMVYPIGASGATNEFLHLIIVLGEGEISAINTIYLVVGNVESALTLDGDGVCTGSTTNGVVDAPSRFVGHITVRKYLGIAAGHSDSAFTTAMPQWTSNHLGKYTARLHVTLKYNKDVFGGVPKILADVDGRQVLNLNTSVTEFSNNPAWCVRDYMTNNRYGRGVPASMIDSVSFIAAAAHCDELIASYGGGPTQKRYTCDGIVNVNTTAYENIKLLLTSCRGVVRFTGGFYRFFIDKVEAPGFTFNADNITGSWEIRQPSRSEKYNRVTASFSNPALNWQSDYAIQQSLTFSVEDGGRLSEVKITLPFTSNIYRAQQIAMIEMKRSRFGLQVHFTALQTALRCETGDVVYVTHETPGWTNKLFRITKLDLKENDEVGVTLREYSDIAYTLDSLSVATTVGSSSLPNPFVVGIPGTPVIVESLYETTGSSGVKVRATITCTPAQDIFVTSYALFFRHVLSDWTEFAPVPTPSWMVSDLLPGLHEAKVLAINDMGVVSAYSITTVKDILGLTAPPATVGNFAVTKIGGVAVAVWDLAVDLDVRIGGRIIVRFSPATSGAGWNDGYILEEFNGDAVSGLLPLITGTYMAKARDSINNYSTNMVSFVATEGMITGFTTVASTLQSPAIPPSTIPPFSVVRESKTTPELTAPLTCNRAVQPVRSTATDGSPAFQVDSSS